MGNHKQNRSRWASLEEVVISDHKVLFILAWIILVLQIATVSYIVFREVREQLTPAAEVAGHGH